MEHRNTMETNTSNIHLGNSIRKYSIWTGFAIGFLILFLAGLFFWAVSKHRLFLYWPMSSYLWGRERVSPDLLSPGVGVDLLARGGTCGRGTDKDGRSQSRLWCRQTSSNNRHVAAASVRRADQRDTRAAMVVDWRGWGLELTWLTDPCCKQIAAYAHILRLPLRTGFPVA